MGEQSKFRIIVCLPGTLAQMPAPLNSDPPGAPDNALPADAVPAQADADRPSSWRINGSVKWAFVETAEAIVDGAAAARWLTNHKDELPFGEYYYIRLHGGMCNVPVTVAEMKPIEV